MPSTIATVTLAVLSVLNLAILLAVVRRLNQLADRRPPVRNAESPLPTPGTKVADFTALTTEDAPLDTAELTGRTLVGFFATGCAPCKEFAPEFMAQADTFPGGRDRVLAVIVAKRGDSTELADRLSRIARVIVEPPLGPAATAFRVNGFPAACLLEDNVVLAADFDLTAIGLPRRVSTPA